MGHVIVTGRPTNFKLGRPTL